MSERLVRCVGVVKKFGDVTAVNGLDLEIFRGECLGMLGPNGAGKTTTVEILEGLTRADSGTVELFGLTYGSGKDDEIRQRIGVQLQETHIADKLTVEEILLMFRSFYPKGRRVDDVIKELSLEEKRKAYFSKLSGGQKQRVALGTALVGQPELLFLDEPTTGLDPQARRNVWDVVEAFRKSGGTVCLTTHYMEEAQTLCNRIAIVDHGRIIAQGTPDELIRRLEAPELVELSLETDQTLPEEIGRLPTVRGVHKTDQGWTVATQSAAHTLPEILRVLDGLSLVLTRASVRKATLEDVFLSLTGRGLRDA